MKKYNFIHFVTDEKFIKDEIRCYEEAGFTNNTYYYVGIRNKPFEFIDNKVVKTISIDNIISLLVREKPNAICLHNLYSLPYDIIANIPQGIPVLWYAWGFDLYSNPAPLNPLLVLGDRYMEKTRKLASAKSLKEHTKVIIKAALKLISSDKEKIKIAKKAISRIDYFAGVFPMEYDMMIEAVPYFRAKKIIHNYIHPQEFKLDDIKKVPLINGHNILLGNSASLFGNHIDIMKQIVPFIDNDVNIICPLSYAGTPRYVQEVIKQGKQLFGNNFVPLTTYLTLEEYTKTIRSCNRFVMGMIQQAATCNCLTSMWDGIKIYAPKRSMNYIQYNNMGIKIYSIEDDFGRESDGQYDNLSINRKIIEDNYSYRAWVRDLEDCIQQLKQDGYAN